MKSQSGFTLIELVVVIVLLGVLAAIAVPRFVNLQDDAQVAQRNATAAAISSAMNINYAACAINNFNPGGDCVAVENCTTATITSVMSNFVAANHGIGVVAADGSFTPTTPAPTIPNTRGATQTCSLALLGVPGSSNFTAIRTALTP